MTFLRRPRIASLLVALLLACAAVVQWWTGPDATPAPVRELLAFLFGIEVPASARLVVAMELAIAAAVLVAGTRVLAVAAAVLCGFVSLACVSAAFRQGGLLLPALALVASLGALILAARAQPRRASAGRGIKPHACVACSAARLARAP